MRAGVKDERITLVCGIGLHRKNPMEEFAAVAVPRPDPHDRPGDRAMRMLVVPEVSRPAVQVRSEEA